MAKIDLSEAELAGLVAEVLGRLAEDESASHLWRWRPRPGCEDEPWGHSRRLHLGALAGLLGVGPMASLLAACGGASYADDPCVCADNPCVCMASLLAACGGASYADDPCVCADNPCVCADHPCAA